VTLLSKSDHMTMLFFVACFYVSTQYFNFNENVLFKIINRLIVSAAPCINSFAINLAHAYLSHS
jgi:hypothetical protein